MLSHSQKCLLSYSVDLDRGSVGFPRQCSMVLKTYNTSLPWTQFALPFLCIDALMPSRAIHNRFVDGFGFKAVPRDFSMTKQSQCSDPIILTRVIAQHAAIG